MTLADRIVALLLERSALPACEIAVEIRRRKTDVLQALHSDPRFDHTGKRKASRWSVREAADSLTWRLDYEEGEEALVTLVRQGRRSPEKRFCWSSALRMGRRRERAHLQSFRKRDRPGRMQSEPT